MTLGDYKGELHKQIIRLSAAEAHLPTENTNATSSIALSRKVSDFLDRYRRGSTVAKNFSGYHPAFFQQMMSTVVALDKGCPLSVARGDGRLAAGVDRVRSIGHGMGKCAKTIHTFLGFHEDDLVLERINYRDLHIVVPVMESLERSGKVFSRLEKKLAERSKIMMMDRKTRRREVSDETKGRLLLNRSWDNYRIEEFAIEYMARGFAYHMSPDVRHQLVDDGYGSNAFSLRQAMDSLKFLPA